MQFKFNELGVDVMTSINHIMDLHDARIVQINISRQFEDAPAYQQLKLATLLLLNRYDLGVKDAMLLMATL